MRDALLGGAADLAWHRPWTVILVALAVAILSGTWAAGHLALNANLDDLIAPDRPYVLGYRAFLEEFGDLENIYVVVESRGDAERTQACVDALTSRLSRIPDLPAVEGAIESEEQLLIATRAMSDTELEDLVSVAAAFPALLSGQGASGIVQDARERLEQALNPGETRPARTAAAAAALFELEVIAAAAGQGTTELGTLLRAPAKEYLVTESGRFDLIEIVPAKNYGTLAVIEEPLRAIRRAVAETQEQFPDLLIGVTGKPVLQADEMSTTNADMTRATVIAVVLVGLLFMIVVGGVVRPILAVLTLLIAIAWTFGLTAITIGQLNLLSVVFTLILVGVGIDFGVHIITRYGELRSTLGVHEALKEALLRAGAGNVTGAITSSAAFFTALLTDFRGLRELGFIAGSGLLLCLLAMTTVLPALLVVVERRRDRDSGSPLPAPSARPFLVARRPAPWVVGSLFAIVLLAPGVPRLGFQDNVLDLQAEGLPSVQWEHRMIEDSGSASWFGAVIADDLTQVQDLTERASCEPTIGVVHSVLDLVKPETTERTILRARLHAPLGAAGSPPPSAMPWTAADLHAASRLVAKLRLLALAGGEDGATLARLVENLDAVANPSEFDSHLTARIETGVAEAAGLVNTMLRGDRLPLRQALPSALRARTMAPSGRFLVSLHPSENVWDLAAMERFVATLRRLDPSVTGAPITHLESIADMKRGFTTAVLWALLAVVLLLLLDFRRVFPTLLALTPLAASTWWLLGGMGLLGIDFNLANFFAVPILIGIGVDNGIHLVHRFQEGGPSAAAFGATHRGVIVTSLTSLIGFGCLVLASHRGLRSLGLVMSLGCVCCLLASLFLLPALLGTRRLHRRG